MSMKEIESEFKKGIDIVIKELYVQKDDKNGFKLAGKRITNCTFQSFLKNDYYLIHLVLDIQPKGKKIIRKYLMTVRNLFGTVHYQNNDLYDTSTNYLKFFDWIQKCIHEHNLLIEKDIFEYYFQDRPCLKVHLFGDSHSKLLFFTLLIKGFSLGSKEILLIRIRSIEDNITFYSYGIYFPYHNFPYDHSIWVFFTRLESPTENVDYYYDTYIELKKFFKEMNRKLKMTIKTIDMNLNTFLYKLERKDTFFNKTICIGPDLTDVILSSIILPKDIEKNYKQKLNKINKEIENGFIDNALRDLRAHVQSSGEYILKANDIKYKKKANINDIAKKLVDFNIIEKKKKFWFEAFHAFASHYSHLIEPSSLEKPKLEVDTWDYSAINIGKLLLMDMWLIISNFPKEMDFEYMDIIGKYFMVEDDQMIFSFK